MRPRLHRSQRDAELARRSRLWVMPSRCCKRTTVASSGGSASIACRTCHTASSVSRSGGSVTIARSSAATSASATRGPARFAAVDVDRGALRDRRQPRRRVAVDVDAVGRLPRAHERLLRRFLGQIVADRARGARPRRRAARIRDTSPVPAWLRGAGRRRASRVHERQRYDARRPRGADAERGTGEIGSAWVSVGRTRDSVD